MRLILLISTSLGLILLNGCAKTNYEENLDQAIGTFSRSIEVDGETREYLIYIPNSYDTIKSVPLLLNFHGFGGSANEFMNDADMRSLAASYSFILVYPQGSSLDGFSHWNACPIGGDNKSDADDFGFVEAIINKVSSQYNIDVERIYSAGYSNALMCEHISSLFTRFYFYFNPRTKKKAPKTMIEFIEFCEMSNKHFNALFKFI